MPTNFAKKRRTAKALGIPYDNVTQRLRRDFAAGSSRTNNTLGYSIAYHTRQTGSRSYDSGPSKIKLKPLYHRKNIMSRQQKKHFENTNGKLDTTIELETNGKLDTTIELETDKFCIKRISTPLHIEDNFGAKQPTTLSPPIIYEEPLNSKPKLTGIRKYLCCIRWR